MSTFTFQFLSKLGIVKNVSEQHTHIQTQPFIRTTLVLKNGTEGRTHTIFILIFLLRVTDGDEGQNSEIQLSCVQEKSSPDACDTFDVFARATG